MDPVVPWYAAFKHKCKQESTSSFISGGIAGAILRTAVSPFERAKILLQLQAPGLIQVYLGMFSTIARMARDEGYKGLFRGNILNCIRIVPYLAVQYLVYEQCKTILSSISGKSEWWHRPVAGSIGGIVLVFVTYPLDLVRARITVQTASLTRLNAAKRVDSPRVWATLCGVYREEGGLRALYRGILPTTLGVAPYVAINFSLYERLRDYMDARPHQFLNPVFKLCAAAFAGFIGGVVIYPLDVLRKRYQVASMANGELGFGHLLVFDALQDLVKQEGIRGAYRGLTANLYKIVPSMAVSWYCYDAIRLGIQNW